MLELGLIQRQLRLGPPVFGGVETIPVAQIVGTTSRARDFDGCFRPLRPVLRKRIEEIQEAGPPAMDEAIEAVRVDRAYFVSDGHKRVAIARVTGREYRWRAPRLLHRCRPVPDGPSHERATWGSVCGEPECIADMLVAEQRRTALDERSALDRVLGREPKPRSTTQPALLLPLTDDEA